MSASRRGEEQKMNPAIIQGGMGIGVSNWQLARAVSLSGQLGVTSGTAVDALMTRRLQDGDIGGHIRRAFESFPDQNVVKEVLERFFKPEGRKPGEKYKPISLYQKIANRSREWLSVLGAYVEVYLAKEAHPGLIGMNLLYKIQLPTMASLYGAMLAKVDYFLIGAGIPREVPSIIEKFLHREKALMKLDVEGSGEETFSFDPGDYTELPADLCRPRFLPIVSSHLLASMLAKKNPHGIDGFIVEDPIAGGHNAPPREKMIDENGEPVYGPKDAVDFQKIAELGKPFWLAGACGNPEKLQHAKEIGAAGIQVGTSFAFCRESGIAKMIKEKVIERAVRGTLKVFTDPLASPTGFPFKIAQIEGTVSEKEVYEARQRICDVGLLRTAYKKVDGSVGFRCPGEPIEEYLKKGGAIENTEGRKCICNGLIATVGLGQIQKNGELEPALVTAGSDFTDVRKLAERHGNDYTAQEVVDYILSESEK